ncbi:twin-arginine translocation signal domain-containing protein [uncultured Sulfitobacter sp.]|uniref:twin-arginine translocation signal domain-containing protein n=1 Tax=uncultured Sulfitobacter sp. TaxID=191468 RepID=UPI00262A37FA|nr:twin-arginine translocation signal domain-containing protein [uncultured Sulfitobacter sp.]
MAKLTRRGFIGTAAAAGALRGAGVALGKPSMRRILTLVYDKSLGMMRAVERVVPR